VVITVVWIAGSACESQSALTVVLVGAGMFIGSLGRDAHWRVISAQGFRPEAMQALLLFRSSRYAGIV